MEANSFQMCQGTREPPLQWTPATIGRLGWAGPHVQDFRIAKAAGQILAQKLHANACVQGEGPPCCTCRGSWENPCGPAALSGLLLKHPTITLFIFLCLSHMEETIKQFCPISGKVLNQHQLRMTSK